MIGLGLSICQDAQPDLFMSTPQFFTGIDPDSYRRVTLGVDILILDRRTQRIIDVVHDLLRP